MHSPIASKPSMRQVDQSSRSSSGVASLSLFAGHSIQSIQAATMKFQIAIGFLVAASAAAFAPAAFVPRTASPASALQMA
eukprot:scaffold170814_cov26-Attheya_sp.AAC.1